jgi:NADH:ubiquinone oxidoreductase subunit 3 (subunit A)
MLATFTGVLVFLVVGIGILTAVLLFARLVRSRGTYSEDKYATYECGEEPQGPAWIQFNVRFYVFALVFIIFDVETIFLFPWAVVFKALGPFAFLEGLIFIVILVVGLAYVWRKGDLEWIKPEDARVAKSASSDRS